MHPNEKQFKYRKKTLGVILWKASYVIFSHFHDFVCVKMKNDHFLYGKSSLIFAESTSVYWCIARKYRRMENRC